MREMIQITDKPILLSTVESHLHLGAAGGQVYFVGTVRNQTKGKQVQELAFECYEPMAIKEINLILETADKTWPLLAVAVIHRVGTLAIGEYPVIIGVSCAHRKEAFEACEFIIDELKKSVPIWKKERFVDGEEWVSAHP
jgi:molybdopterin synthase catalytic subunit